MPKHDSNTLYRFPDLHERNIVHNRTTLKRWMTRERNPFPKPVKLGENSIAWRATDVEQWLERMAKTS
jgi:predicted DNA-binding transcriptional regulator AlpA